MLRGQASPRANVVLPGRATFSLQQPPGSPQSSPGLGWTRPTLFSGGGPGPTIGPRKIPADRPAVRPPCANPRLTLPPRLPPREYDEGRGGGEMMCDWKGTIRSGEGLARPPRSSSRLRTSQQDASPFRCLDCAKNEVVEALQSLQDNATGNVPRSRSRSTLPRVRIVLLPCPRALLPCPLALPPRVLRCACCAARQPAGRAKTPTRSQKSQARSEGS